MLGLLQRAGTTIGMQKPCASRERAWQWRRADLDAMAGDLRRPAPPALAGEIARALGLVRANGLDLDTVEQEDLRLPSFARMVPSLRRLLDERAARARLEQLEELALAAKPGQQRLSEEQQPSEQQQIQQPPTRAAPELGV